jgi:hypothetical protein
MSKIGFLFGAMIYMIVVTFVTQSLVLATTVDVTSGIAANYENLFGGLSGAVVLFWNMLTFQVVGIPAIVNIIGFWAPTSAMLYLIVSLIRGGS